MPYETVGDLPLAIRRLPAHAQEIYRGAFNGAWVTYAHLGRRAQEKLAHQVAWAAVKKRYVKREGGWVGIAS